MTKVDIKHSVDCLIERIKDIDKETQKEILSYFTEKLNELASKQQE